MDKKRCVQLILIVLIVFFLFAAFPLLVGVHGAIASPGADENTDVLADGDVFVDAEVERQMAVRSEKAVPVIITLNEDMPAIQKENENAHSSESANTYRKLQVAQVQEKVLSALQVRRENENGFQKTAEANGANTAGSADFYLHRQYATFPALAGEITPSGLDKLRTDPAVASIQYDHPVKALIDQSVPQINADDARNITVSGQRINGTGVTVCVVDTGVDYTHPALGGCTNDTLIDGTCGKVIGGYDVHNNDNDPVDDHGHGTHVAGIVASENETYVGTAPGAKLVALKVLDSAGSGTTSNVISGIDWCRNNATKYNISVITLSLAECSGSPCSEIIFTSACDSRSAAQAVNDAANARIIVMIAAGNAGDSTGIASPACASNATAVGAVTKSDAVPAYSNSGSLMDLFAPGGDAGALDSGDIISTKRTGGFERRSGTSMAAPHAAGVAALMLQYKRLLESRNITPSEFETKIKNIGPLVNDTRNGILFPRIDALLAIQPFINYTNTSPLNNSIQGTLLALVNVTADTNLTAATLEWTFPNGTVANYTMAQANTTLWSYNITGLPRGTHTYRTHGNDTLDIFGISAVRTLQVDNAAPAITLNAPTNNTFSGNSGQTFNFTATDNVDTSLNCSLFLDAVRNATNETVSNGTATLFTASGLSEGQHNWNISCSDDAGNSNTSETRIFTIDLVAPTIALNAPADSSNTTATSTNFNWTAIDSFDVSLTCNLTVDGRVNQTNIGSVNNSATNASVGGFADGLHSWNVTCADNATNTNTSATRSFRVDTAAPNISFVFPTPANNSYRNTFVVNATATDAGVGIHTISLFIDNALNATCSASPCNVSVNLSEGNHTYNATANDTLGNRAAHIQRTIIVDKTSPALADAQRSPDTIYNNDTVIIRVNVTDVNNISTVWVEGNWSGSSVNVTMAGEGNNRWNATISSANLSNQETVGYRFFANDSAGNRENTTLFTFTVQNRIPFGNISAPANNSRHEPNSTVTFMSSIADLDNDAITYAWSFGDSTNATTGNVSKNYTATGIFTVTLNVSDGSSSNTTTLTINITRDATAPNVTSIVYNASIRLNNNQSVNATLTDATNISNVTLFFRGAAIAAAAQPGGVQATANYSWNWTPSSAGNTNFTIQTADTENNIQNRTYLFNVTSCSDSAQNGDETGVDCGGGCANACTSVGSTGGGGGGGGGGGAGTKAQCEDNKDNDGDGLVDYPADRGCTTAQDDEEKETVCTQDWTCAAWGNCGAEVSIEGSTLTGKQTRICTDQNECEKKTVDVLTETPRPAEEQECAVPIAAPAEEAAKGEGKEEPSGALAGRAAQLAGEFREIKPMRIVLAIFLVSGVLALVYITFLRRKEG